MGYGVGFREGRWIGYMVPAECDIADCHEKIDHGMSYLCERHYTVEVEVGGEEIEIEDDEGCGLYFCSAHLDETDLHTDDLQPKPDSPRWLWWILNEDSWTKWREENPKDVERYQEQIKDFEPDAELLQELEAERAD